MGAVSETKTKRQMDGYVRVSRRMGREGPAYISPTVQREAIQRWADFRDVEIVEWHVDEDQSGGTQNRPGLRAAIQRIEDGKTEGIACWRLNRFARNVAAAIDDVERIQALGGLLAFVEEDIDPTGPFGSFLLTVLLAVATLERDNISSAWKTSKAKAVKRGARIGPALPGYRKGAVGVLELADDAPTMRTAFRKAGAEGMPAVIAYLREHYPERTWTPSTTRRLLASRVYLGEVNYGDLVNTKAHPALVKRREWEAAQIPSTGHHDREPSAEYPLSGLAFCAGCWRPMVGSRSNHTRVYRCKYSQRKGEAPCPEPTVISAERLESRVKQLLRREWVGEGWSVSNEPPVDGGHAEEELQDAEAELYAFAADATLRKALGAQYQELLDERVRAVEEARAKFRTEAKGAAQESRVLPVEVLDDATPAELRELAQMSLARSNAIIEVRRGRGTVEDRVHLTHRSDVPIPAT